jgi:hypothetical protein
MSIEMVRFSPPASPSDNVQPGKNSLHFVSVFKANFNNISLCGLHFIGERNRQKPPTKKVTKNFITQVDLAMKGIRVHNLSRDRHLIA